MGDAPTRRAHKESPEPTPCESTLTVEFGLAMNFRLRTLFPISRAASRKMSNELRSFSGA